MKSKVVILTTPTPWSFTDETTGQFRQGNSAVCYLPFEGSVIDATNVPVGCCVNTCYDCELGFKQKKQKNGKLESVLTLVSVNPSGKSLNWENILK